MKKRTTETRVLQVAHLIASTGVAFALAHADAPWWLWFAVLSWGLLTGVWGFSAGWDGGFAYLRSLGSRER